MKCSARGCKRQAHHFQRDVQWCDEHWQQMCAGLEVKRKKGE